MQGHTGEPRAPCAGATPGDRGGSLAPAPPTHRPPRAPSDTITGLSLNPKGTHLLSHSMDGVSPPLPAPVVPPAPANRATPTPPPPPSPFVHRRCARGTSGPSSAGGTATPRPSWAGRTTRRRACSTAPGPPTGPWSRGAAPTASCASRTSPAPRRCVPSVPGPRPAARARAPPPRRSPRRAPRPCEQLYALPGHAGCVNAVVFHPTEHVVASASSDRSILVGELAS